MGWNTNTDMYDIVDPLRDQAYASHEIQVHERNREGRKDRHPPAGFQWKGLPRYVGLGQRSGSSGAGASGFGSRSGIVIDYSARSSIIDFAVLALFERETHSGFSDIMRHIIHTPLRPCTVRRLHQA